MGKREDRVGKAGQELAAGVLSRLGIEMVEEVGTPTKLIPHPRLAGYYRVIWGKKVSGDHRGILPGGRSVLAEVKTIMDRNLCWSDLRPHQPGALSDHARLGGLSLLVWVHHTGVRVMQWPVPSFGPGKSITPERAEGLSIERAGGPELCDRCDNNFRLLSGVPMKRLKCRRALRLLMEKQP